jgi:hypothetical protein
LRFFHLARMALMAAREIRRPHEDWLIAGREAPLGPRPRQQLFDQA